MDLEKFIGIMQLHFKKQFKKQKNISGVKQWIQLD